MLIDSNAQFIYFNPDWLLWEFACKKSALEVSPALKIKICKLYFMSLVKIPRALATPSP